MGIFQSYENNDSFFNSINNTSIIYCSNQWTTEFKTNTKLQSENLKIFAATPPFNGTPPDNVIRINIPVYGSGMLKKIMELLHFKPFKDFLKCNKIKIPDFAFESFLQGKINKIQTLIDYAKTDQKYKNDKIYLNAISNLQNFITDFGNLEVDDIKNLEDWKNFLGKYDIEYGSSVHFENLLGYFGFSNETSLHLRNINHVFIDKGETKTKTLEEYSLRWLGKILCAYKPLGCFVDIISLIFVMMSESHENISEEETIQVIDRFVNLIKKSDFKNLMIPTHIIHDSENDDVLVWGLLSYIHNFKNSKLNVLVQLPTDPIYDIIDLNYKSKNCYVLRDKESSNMEALNDYFNLKP